jgi:hypothetical protein
MIITSVHYLHRFVSVKTDKNILTMMTKRLFLLVMICTALLLAYCKKCKTCTCWKRGIPSEQTNCAYGFPPTTGTLNVWEDYLREESGYDSVKCIME